MHAAIGHFDGIPIENFLGGGDLRGRRFLLYQGNYQQLWFYSWGTKVGYTRSHLAEIRYFDGIPIENFSEGVIWGEEGFQLRDQSGLNQITWLKCNKHLKERGWDGEQGTDNSHVFWFIAGIQLILEIQNFANLIFNINFNFNFNWVELSINFVLSNHPPGLLVELQLQYTTIHNSITVHWFFPLYGIGSIPTRGFYSLYILLSTSCI